MPAIGAVGGAARSILLALADLSAGGARGDDCEHKATKL